MIGYETIPETPLRGDFRIIKINHDIALRNTIIDYFTHRGFFEVYNYSFSNAEIDRIATTSMDDAIEIRNAFGPENTHLRRSLVPRLLLSAFENTKLSDHFSFFEIGKIFSKHAPRLPRIENGADPRFNEALSLAGVMVGSDIEELKCVIIGFLKTVCPGFSYIIKQGTEVTYLHPNISGQILIEDTSVPVVTYGFLHPSISQSHGQRPETTFVCFEFDFDALHKLYLEAKHVFAPISRFP
jgi:phenylalanyl-tRNA synthetase beta chain